MEQDLVRDAQLHAYRILVLNMDLIIPLFLGKQLAVYELVIKDHLSLDDIPLLTDLPHVKGNLDHVPFFLLFYL